MSEDPIVGEEARGAPRRDPVVVGGIILLAALTIGAVAIYGSQPRTFAEAGTQSWLAARPNAFGANLARARERFERALEAVEAGLDSAAIALDSVAAEHAMRAATITDDPGQQREALRLWAGATLHRAELLRIAGTGVGLRPDDDATLRRALALTLSVDSITPDPDARARADSLRLRLERQLRVGPLEWLPPSR